MNKVEFYEFMIVIEDKVWKVTNVTNLINKLGEDARGMHHELIISIEGNNVSNGNQQLL